MRSIQYANMITFESHADSSLILKGSHVNPRKSAKHPIVFEF